MELNDVTDASADQPADEGEDGGIGEGFRIQAASAAGGDGCCRVGVLPVPRRQRNTGADASAVSTAGIASAAAIVWNAVMPAISGASPPSWRAMMYDEDDVGSAWNSSAMVSAASPSPNRRPAASVTSGIAMNLNADAMHIGCSQPRAASNFSAARFAEALRIADASGLPRYECVQPEYSLVARESFEREYAALAQREVVAVIPFFSLASGFLSGKYRSAADFAGHARAAMLARYDTPRGWRVVEVLHDIAARHRATPAQVALAWTMTRPGITAPIASATTLEQLRELTGALHLRLSAHDVAQLDMTSA